MGNETTALSPTALPEATLGNFPFCRPQRHEREGPNHSGRERPRGPRVPRKNVLGRRFSFSLALSGLASIMCSRKEMFWLTPFEPQCVQQFSDENIFSSPCPRPPEPPVHPPVPSDGPFSHLQPRLRLPSSRHRAAFREGRPRDGGPALRWAREWDCRPGLSGHSAPSGDCGLFPTPTPAPLSSQRCVENKPVKGLPRCCLPSLARPLAPLLGSSLPRHRWPSAPSTSWLLPFLSPLPGALLLGIFQPQLSPSLGSRQSLLSILATSIAHPMMGHGPLGPGWHVGRGARPGVGVQESMQTPSRTPADMGLPLASRAGC